jgi:aspartate-semialdehyde dehydrogenase
MSSNSKIPVGVLGGTGMVGQSFVKFLRSHPWFELTWAGASDRSAGKLYSEATQWRLDGAMPERVRALTCKRSSRRQRGAEAGFSAMDASVATEIERAFAEAGHLVVSNSKNHRMESDVPLLVPEINSDHLALIRHSAGAPGLEGRDRDEPELLDGGADDGTGAAGAVRHQAVLATTMQAISGAGYPGVPSMDIMANVIPFIGGEEGKMEIETQKILGRLAGDHVDPLQAKVSAHCNRVPVVDGHTVAVSVSLEQKVTREQLLAAYESFTAEPQRLGLPSAPPRPVLYLHEDNRPQPRRDALRDNGMTVTVGRLRECPVLDWKFVCLGHNTIRGAAGAAVLNAELLKAQGFLD